jgi:hypothetical protein
VFVNEAISPIDAKLLREAIGEVMRPRASVHAEVEVLSLRAGIV